MGERYARIPARAIGCRELTVYVWRVLACVALHADAEGVAFPSAATIAGASGIRRRDVPRSLRRLEQADLLLCQRRKRPAGGWESNLYRLIFNGMPADERAHARNGAGRMPAQEREGCPLEATGDARSGAALTTQEQPIEQTLSRSRDHEDVSAKVDEQSAREFERLWGAYPSRRPYSNPKKPARAKFEAAVKRGVDPEAIIRGAENYRITVKRNGADPRFVAQAKTWLNEERWNEYQEPPEPPRLRVGMN